MAIFKSILHSFTYFDDFFSSTPGSYCPSFNSVQYENQHTFETFLICAVYLNLNLNIKSAFIFLSLLYYHCTVSADLQIWSGNTTLTHLMQTWHSLWWTVIDTTTMNGKQWLPGTVKKYTQKSKMACKMLNCDAKYMGLQSAKTILGLCWFSHFPPFSLLYFMCRWSSWMSLKHL